MIEFINDTIPTPYRPDIAEGVIHGIAGVRRRGCTVHYKLLMYRSCKNIAIEQIL